LLLETTLVNEFFLSKYSKVSKRKANTLSALVKTELMLCNPAPDRII
tara:strand:+ start:13450 stop:13590 length:141 start_codon:yes stop_codon:yes gene_type:complete